ncbi:hypothetical protein PLICRDRAFT_29654 [Plicaturopsis crispa FD-325 SS-3]|nr:hypothetical protein PLICRDRAFT_29654 [Plicaturopsis crispa FD-325 SS-3]
MAPVSGQVMGWQPDMSEPNEIVDINTQYQHFPIPSSPDSSIGTIEPHSPILLSRPRRVAPSTDRRAQRNLTKNPDYVARPRNSFIIFRCEYSELNAIANVPAKARRPKHSDKTLSKRAAEVWKTMSDAQKQPYHEMAQSERLEHAEKHPSYRFQPSKKTQRQGSRDCQRQPSRAASKPRSLKTPKASSGTLSGEESAPPPHSPSSSCAPSPSVSYPQQRSSSVPTTTDRFFADVVPSSCRSRSSDVRRPSTLPNMFSALSPMEQIRESSRMVFYGEDLTSSYSSGSQFNGPGAGYRSLPNATAGPYVPFEQQHQAMPSTPYESVDPLMLQGDNTYSSPSYSSPAYSPPASSPLDQVASSLTELDRYGYSRMPLYFDPSANVSPAEQLPATFGSDQNDTTPYADYRQALQQNEMPSPVQDAELSYHEVYAREQALQTYAMGLNEYRLGYPYDAYGDYTNGGTCAAPDEMPMADSFPGYEEIADQLAYSIVFPVPRET